MRRTILKQDLALKLYPDSNSAKSAMQQLRREIDICPALKREILKAGRITRHHYNWQQIELILDHFCITPQQFEQL